MEIFIGADHNGFEMKGELVRWLRDEGHKVTDIGADVYDKDDDYPDYGIRVANEVAKKPDERFGIVLCGSGVGMSVIADKVPKIRAATIHDPEIAKAAQRDDDINVLALGSSYITNEQAKAVVDAWLNTPFSNKERHRRRINKIRQYEQDNMCSCSHADNACSC